MCNEYSNRIPADALWAEFSHLKLRLDWAESKPSNLEPRDSIRIRDAAPIVRRTKIGAELAVTPWAWLGSRGKPVFNFRSDGRSFAGSERVLIPADGFYEFTTPEDCKRKRKDKHLFTLTGEPWFWIAGIFKEGAFAMLTTEPGADMRPYHDRQIVVLRRSQALDWLDLARPEAELLRPSGPGTLNVEQVGAGKAQEPPATLL
jgi:putative SOS response-associated peptidase YedK